MPWTRDEMAARAARELRDGTHDEALLGPVFEVLHILTVERLKVSNPRSVGPSVIGCDQSRWPTVPGKFISRCHLPNIAVW